MNVLNRVEKLEQAAGINEPCEVCDAIDALSLHIHELMKLAGLPIEEASTDDPMLSSCAWCLRPVTLNTRRLSIERVLMEKLDAAAVDGSMWDIHMPIRS